MQHPIHSILVIIFIMVFNKTYSQDNCPTCNSSLQAGVFNEHQETYKKDFKIDAEEVFNQNFEYWTSMNKQKAQNLGVEGGFSIFSASVNTSSSESEKRKQFERLKSEYQQSKLQKENIVSTLLQKTASKDVLDAWKYCLDTYCGSKRFIWEVKGGPDEFILTVTYTPKSGSDPDAISISSLSTVPTSTQKVGGNLNTNTQIKKFESASLILKRQESDQDITTTINVSSFGSISIPISGSNQTIITQRDVQSSYNNLPVGTIISSLLDFKTFSRLVGQQINDDDNKMKWAPGDGRILDGSLYSALTTKKELPDLRGVFLRGLNSFTEKEPQKKGDRAYDPDNSRTAGHYQQQDLQSHQHSIDLSSVISFRDLSASWTKNFTFSDKENGYFKNKGVAVSDVDKTKNIIDTEGKETRPINVAVYYYIKIN